MAFDIDYTRFAVRLKNGTPDGRAGDLREPGTVFDEITRVRELVVKKRIQAPQVYIPRWRAVAEVYERGGRHQHI
ncbi:MAG: hypothetical protein ACLTZY_07590 [Alistipes indistinctus]